MSFGFSLKAKKRPVNIGSGSAEDNKGIYTLLSFSNIFENIPDNSVKDGLIFWQGDMYIKNL